MDIYGLVARWERLVGVGPVPIQPTRRVPFHCQIGWRMRERGRPCLSTVAALHHTIRCAISTKAGAIVVRSFIPSSLAILLAIGKRGRSCVVYRPRCARSWEFRRL